MPILPSAIKKMRQDEKKTLLNRAFKDKLHTAIKRAEKEKKSSSVNNAISLVDKAVKKHILKRNTASRITSRLATLKKE